METNRFDRMTLTRPLIFRKKKQRQIAECNKHTVELFILITTQILYVPVIIDDIKVENVCVFTHANSTPSEVDFFLNATLWIAGWV